MAGMDSNPSQCKGDAHPVEKVSWRDCQEFCKRLSQKDGKPYRLPTEAEWEYACRAGTTSPFHFGQTVTTDQANYNGNHPYGTRRKGVYRSQTIPVASFPANAWCLFDMHGNVCEWCQDWFGPYPNEESKDPQGPQKGTGRVFRGGSRSHRAKHCRAACRYNNEPDLNSYIWGFRVCFRLD